MLIPSAHCLVAWDLPCKSKFNDLEAVIFNHKLLKGLKSTPENKSTVHRIQTFLPFQQRLFLMMPFKLTSLPGISISAFIIPPQYMQMEQL